MTDAKDTRDAPSFARPPSRKTLFWRCIAAAALLSSLALVKTSWSTGRTTPRLLSDCHGRPGGTATPARLVYPGEHITWEACGEVGGRLVECSTIHVPMDQFNATNAGNKTFSIPLIRQRGKGLGPGSGSEDPDGLPNLLLNPGGPGGSGISFVHRLGGPLRTIVGEGFHLLSFDPRGVNASRPAATCYPDEETRRLHGVLHTGHLVADSVEQHVWARNFAQSCADTMGEHGWYLNTPQTAADMNSILDAVGQRGLVYWGFSYGTLLGQTYATLFPERAERVIIDGVANQFDWFESLLDTEVFADTENVWAGFVDECAKAGDACPLTAVAASLEPLAVSSPVSAQKVLEGQLSALRDRLRDDPFRVYLNNTVYGAVGYDTVWYNAVFPALYKPAKWPALAGILAQLLVGNATDALLEYGLEAPWGSDGGHLYYFVNYNDGFSGARYWPQDRQTLLQMLVSYVNESTFAMTESNGYYMKQQWAIPRTHTYTPRYGVQTAHPLLILSTTYDPVCPLVSARSAHAAFNGSQIVEVLGYGHCSISVPSVCIARHVRDFLYNGTLPEKHMQCKVDGPYFPGPEAGEAAALGFDDPEEQNIYMAQLVLAREWQW